MIFFIMGPSSSGKDTIYQRLMEEYAGRLKKIVPYTTRPIRIGEVEGDEYHFVDEAALDTYKREGRLLECRTYDTRYGPWHYFTLEDGQLEPGSFDYMVIGTPASYKSFRERFGDRLMRPILIELDDGLRLERALQREMAQSSPRYDELCRRFLADLEDFSDAALADAGIDRKNAFRNESLENCLEDIRKYIEGASLTDS